MKIVNKEGYLGMLYGDNSVEKMDMYYGINREGEDYKKEDCEKIQKSFKKRGVELTLAECRLVYEVYSECKWCAGWESGIDVLDEETIFEMLNPFLIDILNDYIDRINVISKQLVENDLVNLVENEKGV